jgi:biopolymer transport protein ExbD
MAISWNRKNSGDEDRLMAEINTTPLVDVMLVLLIIFLITIPVVNTSILVSLPREPSQASSAQQDNIIISVDAQGATYWFNTRLPDDKTLRELLATIAPLQPQPQVHIRGDARADYEPIGRIVQACQEAGIVNVGFITEPTR